MAIIKIKKESSLQKTRRMRLEKEAKEIQDKKDKAKADLEEKMRRAEIIRPYLTKLEAKIKEKNLYKFWTFTDRSGFKKIHASMKEIKQLVKSDIERFKRRKIAAFTISFYHNDAENTLHRSLDIWLGVSFTVYEMDNDCRMDNPKYRAMGGHYIWKTEDFKTTKFSFKLLEEIMRPVVDEKYDCTSLMGFRVTEVIKDLKKIKVNLSDILNPLAGI